jgi:hypothetical protein
VGDFPAGGRAVGDLDAHAELAFHSATDERENVRDTPELVDGCVGVLALQ